MLEKEAVRGELHIDIRTQRVIMTLAGGGYC